MSTVADPAAAAAAMLPAEAFVKTSLTTIVSGLLLLLSVVILAVFSYCGRGAREDDEEQHPDAFGYTVSIKQVEHAYRLNWAPSYGFPSKVGHYATSGSVLYSIVWGILTLWLAMTAIFFIFAGAISRIEVFRERQVFTASVCTSIALILASLWTITFRTGSLTPIEKAKCLAYERAFREDAAKLGDLRAPPVDDIYECSDGRKLFWIEMSAVLLFVSSVLMLVATAQLQGWSLPGKQLGMLIFTAPGLGLLAGWVIYAFFLNLGVALLARSAPDGARPPPESDTAHHAYKGSLWPIFAAVILLASSSSIPDPAQPLFPFFALFFFTPWYSENLIAAALCAIGIGIATWRVWEFRT